VLGRVLSSSFLGVRVCKAQVWLFPFQRQGLPVRRACMSVVCECSSSSSVHLRPDTDALLTLHPACCMPVLCLQCMFETAGCVRWSTA
jgi:hypothetical protein